MTIQVLLYIAVIIIGVVALSLALRALKGLFLPVLCFIGGIVFVKVLPQTPVSLFLTDLVRTLVGTAKAAVIASNVSINAAPGRVILRGLFL